MAAPMAAIAAPPEDLGDLKLYRVPMRVGVAANQQKQVALLKRRGVAIVPALLPARHHHLRPQRA